jgi:formylglycine-generating enzyme required for sulfatase activity
MKYYELLDVPPDASEEQIRTAYRILVQLHHPDRLQQVSPSVRQYAEERLKKINAAYHILSDPQRRAAYDATWQTSRARAASPFGGDAYDYAAPADPVWEQSKRSSRRRAQTAEEAEAQAAYEAWAHEEAERYARAREAERARQAERENREAEARARRAAEEQFPRARLQGDRLVVHFAPGVWTTLVHVPTGTFFMGSDPEADPEAARAEQPQHRVRLSEYYLGRYPVTNAQWQAFLRATRRAPAAPIPPGGEHYPAVNVSWDDAAAFCQWLTAATGRDFRLPTEAEWEKAARGTDGRRYPWGDEWDPQRLNGEAGPSAGGPTPVDRFSPAGDSPYGAADLLGNVWEWCADWFDPKLYARRAKQLVNDPAGPGTGQGYVVRGGAFDAPARQTRCAYRTFEYPDKTRANLGFRIVAEAS